MIRIYLFQYFQYLDCFSFQFEKDGFLLVEDFLSAEECDQLLSACHDLVTDMKPEEHNTVFTTLEMKRVSELLYKNISMQRITPSFVFLSFGEQQFFLFARFAKNLIELNISHCKLVSC